ncbi:MAG: methyltransferase domain-containing protein [Gammaproteobacteria bacterium]|nr:methyltransferase domain-containing protein [Gammaproteobacteria bacterium]MCI0591690.1 methyltransferase domain-containing protein [Gammaproteobacteria bacterium]
MKTEPTADIQPFDAMAVRGVHEAVMRIVESEIPPSRDIQVLDVGAGRGGLCRRLLEAGYSVQACDLFPDNFDVSGVQCQRVDATGRLPYADASLDLVLAIELIEHLENHRALFNEVSRVLRPGGTFAFSTPNILSLKSRIAFLFTGYFYSFPTLDPDILDPVSQHITASTLDAYRWRLAQSGLDISEVRTDRFQRTSLLWSFLAPLIWLSARMKHGRSEHVAIQNSNTALFGRTLVVLAQKRRQ